LIYRKLTGLSIDDKPDKKLSSENEAKSIEKSENISSVAIDEIKVESEKDQEEDDDEDDDNEKTSSEEGEGEELFKKQSRGKRNEDKESKKVRVY
jgi:hypothetical protein